MAKSVQPWFVKIRQEVQTGVWEKYSFYVQFVLPKWQGNRLLQVYSRTAGRHHSSGGIFRYLLQNLHMGTSPGIEDRITAGKMSSSELAQLQVWITHPQNFCSHLLHNTSLTQDLIRSIKEKKVIFLLVSLSFRISCLHSLIRIRYPLTV